MKEHPVVVVTGASAGVGRATVRAFAARGASVGLIARGSEGLDAARREVEDAGGKAIAVPTDVADADGVERAADAIEQALGPIDVWVNNAMTSIFAPFEEIHPDEFKRVTEVNYLGYVYGTMSALKRMRRAKRGSHYPGRFGAGAPQHSTAIGLLRFEARDHRVHRFAAL